MTNLFSFYKNTFFHLRVKTVCWSDVGDVDISILFWMLDGEKAFMETNFFRASIKKSYLRWLQKKIYCKDAILFRLWTLALPIVQFKISKRRWNMHNLKKKICKIGMFFMALINCIFREFFFDVILSNFFVEKQKNVTFLSLYLFSIEFHKRKIIFFFWLREVHSMKK